MYLIEMNAPQKRKKAIKQARLGGFWLMEAQCTFREALHCISQKMPELCIDHVRSQSRRASTLVCSGTIEFVHIMNMPATKKLMGTPKIVPITPIDGITKNHNMYSYWLRYLTPNVGTIPYPNKQNRKQMLDARSYLVNSLSPERERSFNWLRIEQLQG